MGRRMLMTRVDVEGVEVTGEVTGVVDDEVTGVVDDEVTGEV